MRSFALRFGAPAAMLAVTLVCGTAAAGGPLPLPAAPLKAAETVAEAAEAAARSAESAGGGARASGVGSDGHPGSATTSEAGAPAASRLLRSLSEPVSPPALPSVAAAGHAADRGAAAAGTPVSGVLHGCPRALLRALLESAAETDDAVSALAIERETLALCRERQEIVNGIVALEAELRTLLEEARTADAGAAATVLADTPIVKESAPVRVVSVPPAPDAAEEAPNEAEAPPAPPPAWFWFSIIGGTGDLRAGVGDGALGGTSVWFVREGDRLPGGVLVEEIGVKPPRVVTRMGVATSGAGETLLPYRPLRPDAGAGAGGPAAGGGRAGDGP